MAGQSSGMEQRIDNIIYTFFSGIGWVFLCFFAGFYQFRRKIVRNIFAGVMSISLTMVIMTHFFDTGQNKYILFAAAALLPVLDLIITGAAYKQKQADYQKIFTDIGFKGKDGKAPRYIDSQTGNDHTTIYFKSNIPLNAWIKNTELLQTGLDCKILLVAQGKSKKIVELEYVPTNYDLPTFAPWNPEYLSKTLSEIVIGISNSGIVKFDFNDIAHWIVGGAPGTGKSVLVRLITYQCFLKGFKVYIMDFKRGMEFGKIYDRFGKVVMDKKRAAEVLTELEEKCRRNADILRETGFKNIDEYNKAFPHDPMDRYVIVIDELAVLLLSNNNNKEDKEHTAICTYCLEQIAIIGRAPGFNLVLGIQRPDANTVTGQIKTNVLGRISGYFTDAAPSIIVLQNTKATELPPPSKIKGRYMYSHGQETIEFQGYFLNDFEAMEKLLEEREATGSTGGIDDPDEPESPPRSEQNKTVRKKERIEPDINYDDCFGDAG